MINDDTYDALVRLVAICQDLRNHGSNGEIRRSGNPVIHFEEALKNAERITQPNEEGDTL